MLTLTRAVRVFACAVPVDMRKGFDGLSALVEQQLGGQLLKVFLEGCELAGRWRLSPLAVDEKTLAVGPAL